MSETIWEGWQITEEQRQRMIAGERESLDKFYFDNFPKLKGFAIGYSRDKQDLGFGDMYEAEELLQDAYINFPRLDFSRPDYFVTTLRRSFYWTRFGGMINSSNVKTEARTAKADLFIFDESAYEDADLRYADKYFFSPSPHEEILLEEEQERLEKIEQDIDEFLKGILTITQLSEWKVSQLSRGGINKLRRNADKVIAFLRAHGTDERELSRKVLPIIRQNITKVSAEEKEKKALRDWQESHIDELDSKTRKLVVQRLYQRAHSKERTAYYRKKREAIKQELLSTEVH